MFFTLNKVSARDVMSEKFTVFNKHGDLKNIMKIMLAERMEDVLISDENNKLDGMITWVDISMVMIQNKNAEFTIDDFITRNIVTVHPDEGLQSCIATMLKYGIGRIPVIEDGKILGVIRKEKILGYLYDNFEESRIRLNQTLNSIHEAICVIDEEGKVIVWNKKAEELYDVSAEEIIGNHIKEFFADAMVQKVLETKVPAENVYHTPKKDYHIIINAIPIWIEDKFVGVVSTDRDITEVEKLSKELQKANDTLRFLEDEIKKLSHNSFGNIIGKNEKITKKIEMAKRVAKSKVSVLITGESGTGKELFARAIHEHSGEKGLFVPVNCSAIPNELFESEFFGYEQGAFTGASKKGKIGLFELAQNGTIFLDEIGDLPMYMQAKLLRVLQEKQIKKVGGENFIPVNVRVLSATNRDLAKMVEGGEFREDLFYRINVVEINLPPLRERGEDVLLLINHFLKELSGNNNREVPTIDPETSMILQNYGWKGNIRELKNTIEHLVVLSQDNHITKDLIPQYIKNNMEIKYSMEEENFDLNQSVKQLEIHLIKEALKSSKGSKIQASKLLNIPRATLYYKMEQYKIKSYKK
jgi:PAS domain S-box-containing protein